MQVHYDEGVASHIAPDPCARPPRGCLRSVGKGAYRPAIERVLQRHADREEMNERHVVKLRER